MFGQTLKVHFFLPPFISVIGSCRTENWKHPEVLTVHSCGCFPVLWLSWWRPIQLGISVWATSWPWPTQRKCAIVRPVCGLSLVRNAQLKSSVIQNLIRVEAWQLDTIEHHWATAAATQADLLFANVCAVLFVRNCRYRNSCLYFNDSCVNPILASPSILSDFTAVPFSAQRRFIKIHLAWRCCNRAKQQKPRGELFFVGA